MIPLRSCRLAVALVFALAPTGAFAQADAFAGAWELNLHTAQGQTKADLQLTLEGEKLTGRVNGPIGTVPVEGLVSDGVLALSGSIEVLGSRLHLDVKGQLESGALKGTAKLGDLGEYPFTGKRPASPTADASADGPVSAGTDANGKWTIVLTIAGLGSLPAMAELKQDGTQVTGTFSGLIGTLPVSGTMIGTLLKLDFVVTTPQGPMNGMITGELGAGGFAGKANLAGVGEADWTGTRTR